VQLLVGGLELGLQEVGEVLQLLRCREEARAVMLMMDGGREGGGMRRVRMTAL
jgi:hypothetical protein